MNTAKKKGDRMAVKADYAYKENIKAHGGIWDPLEREWLLPYSEEVWQSLCMSMPLTPDACIASDFMAEATTVARPVPKAKPMPLKKGIQPFKHQYAAYAEAVSLFLDHVEVRP